MPDSPPSSDQHFRSIGQVARLLGVKPHVLRYWEEQFRQIQPLKRAGGRRYYREEDVALLRRIDQLVHRQGYTLRGARQLLEGKGDAGPVGSAAPAPVLQAPEPTSTMPNLHRAQLLRLRNRLAEALAAA